MQAGSAVTTIVAVIAVLVLSTLLLVLMVFYYRRKYIKERDPAVPTITYQPTANNTEENYNATEFDNPLYRQMPQKELEHKQELIDSKRPQNEYATVDEVCGVPDGNSEYTDGYEVPANTLNK